VDGPPRASALGEPDYTKSGYGGTPFFLTFGAEAVLPPEVTNGSPRVNAFDEEKQEQLRRDDIDLLEEKCLVAALRAAKYQQALG